MCFYWLHGDVSVSHSLRDHVLDYRIILSACLQQDTPSLIAPWAPHCAKEHCGCILCVELNTCACFIPPACPVSWTWIISGRAFYPRLLLAKRPLAFQIAREVFYFSCDSLGLAHAAPHWAWRVACPPCLFIPWRGPPRPRSVVQTRACCSLRSPRSNPSGDAPSGAELCGLKRKQIPHNVIIPEFDVSARLTGSIACLYRRCTWGRRPSARWTGSTSTARTSPGWRPSMAAEWASTARRWSCRPLRVRQASAPLLLLLITVCQWGRTQPFIQRIFTQYWE